MAEKTKAKDIKEFLSAAGESVYFIGEVDKGKKRVEFR